MFNLNRDFYSKKRRERTGYRTIYCRVLKLLPYPYPTAPSMAGLGARVIKYSVWFIYLSYMEYHSYMFHIRTAHWYINRLDLEKFHEVGRLYSLPSYAPYMCSGVSYMTHVWDRCNHIWHIYDVILPYMSRIWRTRTTHITHICLI